MPFSAKMNGPTTDPHTHTHTHTHNVHLYTTACATAIAEVVKYVISYLHETWKDLKGPKQGDAGGPY